ncbi:MAG TPA: M23 family metallopeptidase [Allosphingosinicella sp.]|nr:M23 family metallopeptidase [Allosphingosinicella sp.]
MPKWEIRIDRKLEQTHGKTRTVGSYQVYHDGEKATGTINVDGKDVPLFGTTAEAAGPSQNAKTADEGFPTRIVAKTYPMQTSGGPTYVTHGYRTDEQIAAQMPGLELKGTDRRTDILIHPGKDEFRSTVGCINLCTHLDTPGEIISYKGSRRRVIALIEDMKAYLGALPGPDQAIPNAFVVIGEDALAKPEALAANATYTGSEMPASGVATPDGLGWPLRRNVIRGNIKNNAYGKGVRHNANNQPRDHQGWDLLAPVGTQCFAIADGMVSDVYKSTDYGQVVELSFRFKDQKLFAAYAHLSEARVKKGEAVKQGQLVGLSGDSGNAANLNASEKHLHFEIRTVSRPGIGLGGRMDPTKVYGMCPLKDAVIWSPDGETAPTPKAAPAPKPAGADAKPNAMDRKPVFAAVRTMIGRGFKQAEVKALDDACDLALAAMPFDRRPIFDAVRMLRGRGFEVAEVKLLDEACDVALALEKPAPGTPDKPAAPPSPPASGKQLLGSISEVYESGKRGPGTVSSGKGDPGGVSYGVYQLSSNAKTLTAFMKAEGKKWAAEFGGAAEGGAAFSSTWEKIAKREPDDFRAAQHAFIERTHYQPAVAAVVKSNGLDLDSRHDAVREATWSVSVQHGGAATILGNAAGLADQKGARGDPGYDRGLVEAIYKARTDYVLNIASGKKKAAERDQLISITKNRYPSELADVLKLFG